MRCYGSLIKSENMDDSFCYPNPTGSSGSGGGGGGGGSNNHRPNKS
jgi:hypothetical protein